MWLAESELVDVCTQGHSESDARAMLADAFETLMERPGVKVRVEMVGKDGEVTIECSSPGAFAAFVLQRLRLRSGRSLSQVAKTMGLASKNAYARYEQGDSAPTLAKFEQLLGAVADDVTLIVGPRKVQAQKPRRAPTRAANSPKRTARRKVG